MTKREEDTLSDIARDNSMSRDSSPGGVSAPGSRDAGFEPPMILGDPFSLLQVLPCRTGKPTGRVLLVMPLTGHPSVLVRDLVLSLGETHEVALLDWKNARDVPAILGPFGFDDQIDAIIAAIQAMPSATHVLGICQSGLPVLAAAAALGTRHKSAAIQSLTFMGVPFDPSANPTELSNALCASSRIWLELFEITIVDKRFEGFGRRVYPASQQVARVQNYISKHNAPDNGLYRKLRDDDGLDPERFPFLRSLTDLKDIPADLFLENIDRYFHRESRRELALSFNGEAADTQTLMDIPILTLEGEDDDIVAPGQTSSLHRELPQSAEAVREHVSVSEAGHFDLFHGRICRHSIAPYLLSFFERARSSTARLSEEFGDLPDGENRG